MSSFLRNAASFLGVEQTEAAVCDAMLQRLEEDSIPVPTLHNVSQKIAFLKSLMSRHPMPESVVHFLKSVEPAW